MNFSKDELAMVYQYAAGTKEDTIAGLKEIRNAEFGMRNSECGIRNAE